MRTIYLSLGMDRSLQFYSDLHAYKGKLEHIYGNKMHFCEVPDSWSVIVTDVQNSTIAVEAGKQKQVNIAATGSIVACLNISRVYNIEIPFFFGGDGATILVPDQLLNECLQALNVHRERCFTSFEFLLRVGYRNVADVKKNGAILNISKYRRNKFHIIPLIQGNGLQLAETEIKLSNSQDMGIEELNADNLDLSGMECKWDLIPPPVTGNEVLTLIINAVDVDQQWAIYSEILEQLNAVYGSDKKRNPLAVDRLKVTSSLSQLRNEVRMKYATSRLRNFLSSLMRALFGKAYLKNTQKGRNYLNELVQLTEFLLMDGSINTVITGAPSQREQMLAILDKMEDEGNILYGYYISTASVLSCYVTTLDDYHVHFVDGENGGYTRASKVLKQKLQGD